MDNQCSMQYNQSISPTFVTSSLFKTQLSRKACVYQK